MTPPDGIKMAEVSSDEGSSETGLELKCPIGYYRWYLRQDGGEVKLIELLHNLCRKQKTRLDLPQSVLTKPKG